MSVENPFANKRPEPKKVEPGKEILFEEEAEQVSPEFDNVVENLKKKGANSMALYLDYMEPDKKNTLVADLNNTGHSFSILEKLDDHELTQALQIFKKWSLARDRAEQRQIMKSLDEIIG